MKAKSTMSLRVPANLYRRAATVIGGGAACAVVVAIAGCASSGPTVHLHTLMPAELPPRTAAATTARPLILEIRLPSQVEQPQLLVRLPDESLMSLEQERWASPLRDELRQALFEELGARYGIVEARSSAGSVPPRVSIDIRRFDSLVGVESRIEGAWSLTTEASGPALQRRCDWLYREPASGGVAAIPVAHRKAIVRLADAIGEAITAPIQSATIPCPPSDLR